MSEIKLKALLRKKILDIGGLLKEEIDNPNLDFGFKFLYPNQNGPTFQLSKPKNKSYIEIGQVTTFSLQHLSAFNSYDNNKKVEFIKKLQDIILNKEHESIFEAKPDRIFYVIIERIFFKNNISINILYQTCKAIYSCHKLTINFIQREFPTKTSPEEPKKPAGSDSRLYT